MKLQRFKKLVQASGIVTGLAIVAFAVGTLLNLNGNTAAAADCSANAILTCGTSSASDFIAKIRSSNGGQNPDLAAIYASYNLTSADYNRFVTSAVPGTAYKDGTIQVNGRIVATNAQSIGRSQKSYSHAKVINGHTYWESAAQAVFLSNSIPVMVLFNSQGQMQFAVMNDCGNPTSGNVASPTFSCNNLATRKVDRNTFAFSTSASAGNGATIDHVVYDFGDGVTASRTNPAEEVTHSYASNGNFTAKVTVYVKLPGASTLHAIVPAGDCTKQITVTPPPPTPVASCTLLTVASIDRTNFRLSATAATSGGATISRYVFAVTDSAGHVVASPAVATSATSATANVSLTTPGSYTAKVTVSTSVGAVTSANCQKPITVAAPPVAACKQLTVTALDRTTYKLVGAATVSGGATVQGYNFVVKSASGAVVASPSITSSSLTATTNVTVATAGKYTVALSVRTSEGTKTATVCVANFTVPEKPIPPVPSVSIVKDVDGVKSKQVDVGQQFTYHITVTNDGKVNLKNVLVSDTPPAGVTLLSADKGTITNNKWSYTIPTLNIGNHMTFALTAQVPSFVAGDLVNTACVNAPGVPNQPLCDTATVTVTPPPTPTPTPPTPAPPTQELPNTGAGNVGSVVGIFATTVIFAGMAYRLVMDIRQMRASRM